ncbi:hypothetical protein DL95DRAFT_394200 [Leptodontidium sp. 2 PMI_412]|nr:hypothetical protein DL95DRAFT_394200 [Leptodontidium sp. 2 PMI_412]
MFIARQIPRFGNRVSNHLHLPNSSKPTNLESRGMFFFSTFPVWFLELIFFPFDFVPYESRCHSSYTDQ